MKILHVVEDFSVMSGGLRTVINDLNHNLNLININSFIISSKKEKDDQIYTVKSFGKWCFSKYWIKSLDKIVKEKKIDVIHIHGIWLYPQYVAAKYALRYNIPFVLSAHGMLQPWLWKKGYLKKNIYFNILIKRRFSKASVIHNITGSEGQNLLRFFPNNNFKEIPNLISIIDNDLKGDPKKYILYLGRLNRTKGIDLLIEAFSELSNKQFKLKIAGGKSPYLKEINSLIKRFDLKKRVEFVGIVKTQQKNLLIKNAWLMVAPTFSDVIGMVNLEAAAHKTPMITTNKTGLKAQWNLNGGRLINPNVNELKMAMEEATNWTLSERNKNGEKLFSYVKNNYSWQSNIGQWKKLYDSALKKK